MKMIAVDAACTKDQVTEFRGVDLDTGQEIFHRGPHRQSSVNIAETLACVLGIAWCRQQGYKEFIIFSDSQTALFWIRAGKFNSNVGPCKENMKLLQMVEKAEAYLESFPLSATEHLLKWSSKTMGENPSDFARKGSRKGPRSQVPARKPKQTKKKK